MIVRWSRRAAVQLFEAGDYLKQERPGAEEQLYIASKKVTALVARHPRAFPRMHDVGGGEVRWALVQRYGYRIIFEIFEERGECIVLAFWPTQRHPSGWVQP